MNFDWGLVLFVAIQFIAVVLATVRLIMTVDGSYWQAAWFNAISCTFGAVATKLLTQQDFIIIIAVVMGTNIVGAYFGKWLVDYFSPNKIWTVMTTVRGCDVDALENELLARGIKFVTTPGHNDRFLCNVFAHTKGERLVVLEVLDGFRVKYSVVENV